MIVLDTDTLTVMQRHDSALRKKLLDRLADTGPDDLATTIITYEEQPRGWLEYKARAKDISQEIEDTAGSRNISMTIGRLPSSPSTLRLAGSFNGSGT
jgi:hypothetical protein